MKTFKFHTLGCKVNQYESEAMEEILMAEGYREAGSDEEADLHVINTCSVTHMSDAKSRQLIRRMKRKNPDALIAVVGCYAQLSPKEISQIEGVDIILGTKGRSMLPKLIEDFKKEGKQILVQADLDKDRAFDELNISTELSNTRAAIKIQEGCDMFCSYCIIPYARGHIASRPVESVINEVKRLAGQGFKEVVLTGIHIASYAKEKGFVADYQGKAALGAAALKKDRAANFYNPSDRLSGPPARVRDLSDLIELIARVRGIERIRLSSIEPGWVNKEKLIRLKESGKFCPHFHLSLQSGSDKILEKMNRKYNSKFYAEKIEQIREVFPDAGITTDVIVGFPGEDDEDFQDSMNFCKSINFSRMHIFQYSPRPNTPAALFTDQVDPLIKKKRAELMAGLEKKMRYEFMKKHLGRTMSVLIEEGTGKKDIEAFKEGYTANYVRVKVPSEDLYRSAPRGSDPLNNIYDVRLKELDADKIIGEIE